MSGGGVNCQLLPLEKFSFYVSENGVIPDQRIIERVAERLKSKGFPGFIEVKKFDAVIKPYLTRVKKSQEVKLQLA